jgi:MFS family permease
MAEGPTTADGAAASERAAAAEGVGPAGEASPVDGSAAAETGGSSAGTAGSNVAPTGSAATSTDSAATSTGSAPASAGSASASARTSPSSPVLHLHRWTDLTVVGVALAALMSGFGQFGAVAALGDVAKAFGHVTHGGTVADQAGLSGTLLGVGLAIIRLASLGGLPVASIADRVGRRMTLLVTAAVGLLFTVAAAASPGYWWFVALFALGRPFLSATNAVAQVTGAEQTATADRSKAVALIAAGYAVGAGITAVLHSLGKGALGFRGVFALAVVPLALLPLVARWVSEPDRFTVEHNAVEHGAAPHSAPVLGAVSRPYWARLAIVSALTFAVSVITGPANSFVFIYAQNVLRMAGYVTALMVVLGGAVGLVSLLLGRWLADRIGRRPTCAFAIFLMAASASFAYSGSRPALIIGYAAGVAAGAIFAPGAGAFLNELFPTSVRASVAGWQVATGVLGAVTGLIVFGAVADAGAWSTAALVTFWPAVASVMLFLFLPETRGRELEELWPST